MFYKPMQLWGMVEMSSCGGLYHHDVVRTREGWMTEWLVEENVCGSWTRCPERGLVRDDLVKAWSDKERGG
jgi:hypothetical protein